jgi:hypothetical protein
MEAQQVIIEAYTNALAASVKKKIDDARHARKVQKVFSDKTPESPFSSCYAPPHS